MRVGWTPNCAASSLAVRSPRIAARATWALNAAVWTFRFVPIATTSGDRQSSLAGGPKSGVHYSLRSLSSFSYRSLPPVFTKPSSQTFQALLTGWCLSIRQRFVTELILSSGSTHHSHHSCYHRFFSAACWSLDTLWYHLARLLLATFAPVGLVELAGDDTLCRKRGLTIYGTGMHHDPLLSSRALKAVSCGHDWVG